MLPSGVAEVSIRQYRYTVRRKTLIEDSAKALRWLNTRWSMKRATLLDARFTSLLQVRLQFVPAYVRHCGRIFILTMSLQVPPPKKKT